MVPKFNNVVYDDVINTFSCYTSPNTQHHILVRELTPLFIASMHLIWSKLQGWVTDAESPYVHYEKNTAST